MIYLQFFRFLFPLLLTVLAIEFGGQVLNGGMARMPQATETFASYGLAWGLMTFLTSPLSQTRQLGLVLVDSRSAHRKVRLVVLICGLLLAGVLASLAMSPLGTWVIEVLHGVDRSLAVVARQALRWLVPIPVISGLLRLYSGMVIRVRRTEVVSAATLANIMVSMGTVFALLPTRFVQTRPIRLPLLVTYAGLVAEIAVVWWGYRRFVHSTLPAFGHALSYRYILRFFWPLALIMAVQGFSRPLINLFVSRVPHGMEGLAVLTIVFALGRLPYSWLNDIRSLHSAFKDEADSLAHIRRFALGLGLTSFGVMALMFWTPLRVYLLDTLLGVSPALMAQCQRALALYPGFPLTVMARAYLHGVALLEHRTKPLAPSGPARIAAILAMLLVLPRTIDGATRGSAALLFGFVIETIAVWWGVRGPRHFGLSGRRGSPGWG
jgi:hypothetical protein